MEVTTTFKVSLCNHIKAEQTSVSSTVLTVLTYCTGMHDIHSAEKLLPDDRKFILSTVYCYRL